MYRIIIDSNCSQNISASDIFAAGMYEQAILDSDDQVFIITPSAYSSDSYEKALEAADSAAKKGGTDKVHVIDLDMAGSGLQAIIAEIKRLESIKLTFDEIVGRIAAFQNNLVPFCA